MKKKLLLIGYEYQGFHSPRGAALSRRIKQIAESYASNNWEVSVIHKDSINESGNESFIIKKEGDSINRIVVKLTRKEYEAFEVSLIRMLATFYYLLFKGDRTYKWAKDVLNIHKQFNLQPPDLIISCFTPRAPLFLGQFFAELYKSKWIVDLQDEIDHGNNFFNKRLSHFWTRKTIKNANVIVHVSPEWARRDGKILNREIFSIRHAIPANNPVTMYPKAKENNKFVVFYGGSISEGEQSLDLLARVMGSSNLSESIKIVVAGHRNTYEYFKRYLSSFCEIEYVGWLSQDQYYKQIASCDCYLIIPWSHYSRQVVPSKFYELAIVDKPIWIIGNDTGAFKSLMKDYECPYLEIGDYDFQKNALYRAVKGDFRYMFTADKCGVKMVSETDLYDLYSKLL